MDVVALAGSVKERIHRLGYGVDRKSLLSLSLDIKSLSKQVAESERNVLAQYLQATEWRINITPLIKNGGAVDTFRSRLNQARAATYRIHLPEFDKLDRTLESYDKWLRMVVKTLPKGYFDAPEGARTSGDGSKSDSRKKVSKAFLDRVVRLAEVHFPQFTSPQITRLRELQALADRLEMKVNKIVLAYSEEQTMSQEKAKRKVAKLEAQMEDYPLAHLGLQTLSQQLAEDEWTREVEEELNDDSGNPRLGVSLQLQKLETLLSTAPGSVKEGSAVSKKAAKRYKRVKKLITRAYKDRALLLKLVEPKRLESVVVAKDRMQVTVLLNRIQALCAKEDDGSGPELLDSPWFPLKDTGLHACKVLHWVGKVDAYFDSTPIGVKVYGLESEEFAEAMALVKEGATLMIRFTLACKMIVPGSIQQQQRLGRLFEGSRMFALGEWRARLHSTYVEIQWNQRWYLAFVEAFNTASRCHRIVYEQGHHAEKISFCPKAVAIKFRPKNGRCEILSWRRTTKRFDTRARPPPLQHLVNTRVYLRGPESLTWPVVVTSMDPVTERFRVQHTDTIDSDSFYFTHDNLAILGDGKAVYQWKSSNPGRTLPSSAAPEVSAAAPFDSSLVTWAKDRVKQIEAFQAHAYENAKRASLAKPSTIGIRSEAREAIATALLGDEDENGRQRSAAVGSRARMLESTLFERKKFSERLVLDGPTLVAVLQYIRKARRLQDLFSSNEKMRAKALAKKPPNVEEFLSKEVVHPEAVLEKLAKISKTDKARDKIARKVEQAEAKAKDLEETLGDVANEVEDPERVEVEKKEKEKVEEELETIIATEKETRAALPSFGDVEVLNESIAHNEAVESLDLKRPREEDSIAAEFKDIISKRAKGIASGTEDEESGSRWSLGKEPTEMMEWTGRFKKDTMMCDVRVCMMEEDYGIALPSRRVKAKPRMYSGKQLNRSLVLNVLPQIVEPSGTIRVAKVLDYVNSIRLSASEREIFLATMHLRARDPAAQQAFQGLEEEGRAAVVDSGSDMIIYILPMGLAKPGFLSGAPRPKSQPLALVVFLLRPGHFPSLCHVPAQREARAEVTTPQVQPQVHAQARAPVQVRTKETGMSAQSLSLLRQPDAISKLQEQLRMLTRKN